MFLSWMISSGEKNSEKNVIYLFIIDWSQQQQKTEKKRRLDWNENNPFVIYNIDESQIVNYPHRLEEDIKRWFIFVK